MAATSKPSPTPQAAPVMSIVIASVNGWHVLKPTLDSLDALPERPGIEVVVVETTGDQVRKQLGSRQLPVRVVESERLPIPRLRYRGVHETTGAVVAILEDHASVDPGWAKAILSEHEGSWGAVGGPVENGQDGLINWAVYFCEYASYMAPLAEGAAADLPGNNIAYKRPHLLKHAIALDEGKWESWINDRIRADGVQIAASNAMVVSHIKPFRLGYFLVQRFHFARSYAGMRRVDQSWPRRLAYGAGSVILPGLLTLRVTRTVLSKRRYLAKFALAFPLVALFMTVGAIGEMIGYLVGPGSSLARVE